jgi:hypothetical protein
MYQFDIKDPNNVRLLVVFAFWQNESLYRQVPYRSLKPQYPNVNSLPHLPKANAASILIES